MKTFNTSVQSKSTGPIGLKTLLPRFQHFWPPLCPSSDVLQRAVCFCVALVVLLAPPCAPKTKVNLHALIPSNVMIEKEFEDALHKSFLQFALIFKVRSPRMYRMFDPSGNLTFLRRDEPLEILNAFCNDVLAKDTVTLLILNNPDVFGRRPEANAYIMEIAESLGIPVISWDAEYLGSPRNPEDSLALQIAPTIHHQARAIFSLFRRYNWTQFAVVTTHVAGSQEFLDIVQAMAHETEKKAKVTIDGEGTKGITLLGEIRLRNTSNPAHVKFELGKVIGVDARIIILHCKSVEALYILEGAASLGLTGPEYLWILTQSAVAITATNTVHKTIPVGTLAITFDHKKEAMDKAIRNAVKIWLHTLLKMSDYVGEIETMSFPGSQACNTSDDLYWKDGKRMYRYLKNVSIHSEPLLRFDENGTLQHTEVFILNVQPSADNGQKQWQDVGRWTRNRLLMKDIVWPGGSNVPPSGRPARSFLRIATLEEYPYVMYTETDKDGACSEHAVKCRVYVRDDDKNKVSNQTMPKCCVGLSIDLLRVLSRELEFDFDLFEVEDGKWGALNKVTGRWNGLIETLLKREADMVVTSLKINPDRNRAVRFSVPYMETGITIVVSLREGAISPTAFLEPFDITSWILILMLCIHVVALGVYIFEWLSPTGVDRGDKFEEPYDYPSWCLIIVFSVHATGASIFIFEWLSPYGMSRGTNALQDHRFSLFRSFWLIWAMLFSAAVETDTPKGVSSRFLANIWALFAVVFLASYTANLAAFMITKEEYYDLSGIQDWRLQKPMQMNPPFKYATVPNGSTETNIRNNHLSMYNYMRPFNKPSVVHGIDAVKKSEIQAFIYDATVLEYYAGKDPGCRLRTVGNWYAMTGYGVAFPPGPESPWVEKINKIIFELQGNGEMERLQKFWLAGACYTEKEKKGVSNKTLGILNFTSAFILLGGGVLLSALLLLFEHFYFHFGRRCLKKSDNSRCLGLISLNLGKSLSIEQSADSLVKHKRCRDHICDTQIWRLRHQLDMALLKIENLQNQISSDREEGIDNALESVGSSQRAQDYAHHNGDTQRQTAHDRNAHNRPESEKEAREFPQEVSSAARLRRSPSYTSAIGGDILIDSHKFINRSRFHDGKIYVGVDSDGESSL